MYAYKQAKVQEKSGQPEKRNKPTRNRLALIGLLVFAVLITLTFIGLFHLYPNSAPGQSATPELGDAAVSAAESQSITPMSISPSKQGTPNSTSIGIDATFRSALKGEQEHARVGYGSRQLLSHGPIPSGKRLLRSNLLIGQN